MLFMQEDGSSGCEGQSSCTIAIPAAKRIKGEGAGVLSGVPEITAGTYQSNALHIVRRPPHVMGDSERNVQQVAPTHNTERAEPVGLDFEVVLCYSTAALQGNPARQESTPMYSAFAFSCDAAACAGSHPKPAREACLLQCSLDNAFVPAPDPVSAQHAHRAQHAGPAGGSGIQQEAPLPVCFLKRRRRTHVHSRLCCCD